MASSELRRSDRRGVTPRHLLYMAMKIMRLRIRDSLTIAFKYVGKDTIITKKQIQNNEYVDIVWKQILRSYNQSQTQFDIGPIVKEIYLP